MTETMLMKIAKIIDGWIHNKLIQDRPSERHIRKWHSDGRGIGRCSHGYCMSDRRYRRMKAVQMKEREIERGRVASYSWI